MNDDPAGTADTTAIARRQGLKLAAGALAALSTPIALSSATAATEKDRPMKAFVYTELQISAPFNEAPWQQINAEIRQQPGLLSKTWLSGVSSATPGGFYAFDTVENARRFAIDYFPTEAASLNAAFYTRVFDAAASAEASRDMNSPFYI